MDAITISGSLTLNIDYGFPNKITISSPSSNQVLQYDGTKWINTTPSSGTTTLAGCTDCSISSPSNDQLLIYTTASSLNKWTPYTISGATFNDTNKTITISAGLQVHYQINNRLY